MELSSDSARFSRPFRPTDPASSRRESRGRGSRCRRHQGALESAFSLISGPLKSHGWAAAILEPDAPGLQASDQAQLGFWAQGRSTRFKVVNGVRAHARRFSEFCLRHLEHAAGSGEVFGCKFHLIFLLTSPGFSALAMEIFFISEGRWLRLLIQSTLAHLHPEDQAAARLVARSRRPPEVLSNGKE